MQTLASQEINYKSLKLLKTARQLHSFLLKRTIHVFDKVLIFTDRICINKVKNQQSDRTFPFESLLRGTCIKMFQ